ncbi:MAG: hypothetical protein KTR14_05715 [Vampirovibrio sp.]|nr:hypothetical protein [Vampirovibrio sp.]
MADVQAQVEAAVANFTNFTDLSQQTVTYQGQNHPLSAAIWMIGANGPEPSNWATNVMDIQNASPALATYQQLYQEAMNSGALSNPAVNAIVSELALQTTFLVETTEHQVTLAISAEDTSMLDPAEQLSLTTHYNSAGICQTGGNTTSGVQCI